MSEDEAAANGSSRGELRSGRGRLRAGAAVLLVALAAIFIFGPEAIERASEARPGERFALPGPDHLLGTDDRGRDTLTRVAVALGATGARQAGLWFLAFVAGTAVGIVRGMLPRFLQSPIGAFYRSWECFPMVSLAGVLVISSGVSGPSLVLLLGAMGAVSVSRRVGDVVDTVAAHNCYRAAAASCVPWGRRQIRYRVPQACRAGFHAALAFLAPALIWETSLSFISPEVAVSPWSLGSLIREGSPYFMDAPWLVFSPAGILFLLVLGFRLIEAVSASRLRQRLAPLSE